MTNHKWLALGDFRYICEVCGDKDTSQVCGNLPRDGCFHPDSFLGRRGGMVPTVQLGPNASQGVTPERQALMDIQEYMKNFDGTRCAFTDIQEIIDEVLHE